MAADQTLANDVKTREFEIHGKELKVLNGLENWGTSLFLTAILLTSKQLVDWSIPIAPATQPTLTLQWQLFLLPAVFGFAGFIFLRVVNFRIRCVRREIYAMVNAEKPPSERRKGDAMTASWGTVGWSMALMPLVLGLTSSWFFGLTRPELEKAIKWVIGFAVFMLIVAAIAFNSQTSEER